MIVSRMPACRLWLRVLLVIVIAVAASDARAAVLQANPDNYRALLTQLKPGDELLLAPGIYRSGMPLHGVRGTARQPIIIRGPANGAPAVFFARAGHNTISLSNTAHVHIRHLILDGRNLDTDAVKAEGRRDCVSVHHMVLEDLLIIGHGAHQQLIGISSKCLAWNWVILRNVIIGAGTGMYLGDSDGNKQFFAGLIEQNVVLDTLGYNVQIKHQNERPQAPGMPMEHTRTVIRHNLFSKAHLAAPGINARPNLLLGHFPRQGAGADDGYEVAHNVFFCNPVEALLQAEGHLAISGNVLLNPAGDAVAVMAHNDVPKTVMVQGNFVAASARGVGVFKGSPAHTQSVVDNWIHANEPINGGSARNNQIAAYASFAAAESQLQRWLKGHAGANARANAFAPLVAAAQRVCAGMPQDWPAELTPALESIGQHPACRLIEVLAGVRPAAERVAGVCLP
ncbi:MAG: hypothetical protein FJY56_03100 [Betaproteobacteria bacterium]|nr:hypothetical protein [Betaproteobacteria bacterium]